MIVTMEDELGISLYDYVVHVSKINGESAVKMTQATLDQKLIGREFKHGNLIVMSDKGFVVSQYDLGPKPPEFEGSTYEEPQ